MIKTKAQWISTFRDVGDTILADLEKTKKSRKDMASEINKCIKEYYEHFENVKDSTPSFASILTYLYECTGNIEPSFSSKMLATIFPDKPIWDRYVVQNLNMELVGTTKEERLANAIALYADMEKWYADFLQTDKAKECIEAFDRVMPDYKHISTIKKIDSILWSIR